MYMHAVHNMVDIIVYGRYTVYIHVVDRLAEIGQDDLSYGLIFWALYIYLCEVACN